METITLQVQDIEILKAAQFCLQRRIPLDKDQLDVLATFLLHLPEPATLLLEDCAIDESFEIKVIDIRQVWHVLYQWLALFNALPKNGSQYPFAGLIDGASDIGFWKRNVIIYVAFIPSYTDSLQPNVTDKLAHLELKTDGSAYFAFFNDETATHFPDLKRFNGSWKEAYLLLVKTLKSGWPQVSFPPELEQFLK